MKYFLIILAFAFTSCATQQRCYRLFPPQIITKDSVITKDSIIYKSVKVSIPGDSVTLHDTIPCPEANLHKEQKSKSGRTTATLDIKNGNVTVKCHEDSLTCTIDSLKEIIRIKESYHAQVKTVDKPVVKKVTPTWCWILLVAVIAYLVFLFKNPLFTLLNKLRK